MAVIRVIVGLFASLLDGVAVAVILFYTTVNTMHPAGDLGASIAAGIFALLISVIAALIAAIITFIWFLVRTRQPNISHSITSFMVAPIIGIIGAELLSWLIALPVGQLTGAHLVTSEVLQAILAPLVYIVYLIAFDGWLLSGEEQRSTNRFVQLEERLSRWIHSSFGWFLAAVLMLNFAVAAFVPLLAPTIFNLPATYPIHFPSFLIDKHNETLNVLVADSYQATAAYYLRELPRRGWQVTDHYDWGGQYKIIATKNGHSIDARLYPTSLDLTQMDLTKDRMSGE